MSQTKIVDPEELRQVLENKRRDSEGQNNNLIIKNLQNDTLMLTFLFGVIIGSLSHSNKFLKRITEYKYILGVKGLRNSKITVVTHFTK